MSAPTGTPVPARTHVVIGDVDQVRAAMQRAHEAGRLVAVREADRLPDARVRLVVDLHDPAAPRRRWIATRAPWLIVAAVIAAAAVGGVVWLVALGVLWFIAAVTAAVAWVAANWVLFAAVAVLVLLTGGGAAARCAGLHCGGCRG